MRHKLIRIGSALLVSTVTSLLATSVAYAGARDNVPVTADPTNRYAEGALGSARNSADTEQRLYCYTEAFAGDSYAGCVATNASGVTVSCFSSSPQVVQTVSSINGDSYVEFAWDTSGNCTYVFVYNSSSYAPKAP